MSETEAAAQETPAPQEDAPVAQEKPAPVVAIVKPRKSALRATKMVSTKKRLKLFLFGDSGAGKTTAAISFPNSYVIDGEKGTENYEKRLEASGSKVFQTTDVDDVVEEIRILGAERHDYRTLVIDPITGLEADLIEKAEKEFGPGDMRIWGKRDRTLRRMTNLIMNLDMNVIVTAHGKIEYGDKMTKLGTTFDGWRKLPYLFDLVIELQKRGKGKRVAVVKKTRLEESFPDGAEFDFSYAELARRYGEDILSRPSTPVDLASPEQVAALKSLLEVVKLEEGTVEAWFRKAAVDTFEDMSADVIQKCIEFVHRKIAKTTAQGAAK